ncbi:MAG: protein phosphatase 2C domain-containing protein [Acidobacteriota bacterium]|nr:protein phosphatase 2C domain-containing protein [Acidobacteriota bacterium]
MLKTTVGQITDKGLKRQANEDNLLALPEQGLFLVADGVGGRRGGQTASRTVTEVFEKVFSQPQPPASPESQMEELRALIASTVDLCNQKIYTEAEMTAELDGMATTLALAAVRGKRAIVAHVGDSRVYRCDPQGLIQLTEDHSEVGEAVRAGLLTPEQAENHPRRNVISRALGADSEVEAEIIEIEIDRNTTLLLCSDGITRHIRDDQLERLLRSGEHPQAVCQTMKQLCYNEGAEDNLTAIIINFNAQAEADEQTRPIPSMRAKAAASIASQTIEKAERPKKFIQLGSSADPNTDAVNDESPPADGEALEDAPEKADVEFASQPTSASVSAGSRERKRIQDSDDIAAHSLEQKVEMSKFMRLSVMIVILLAGFVLGGLFGAPLSRIVNQGQGSNSLGQPPRMLRYTPSDPNVADAYGMLLSGRTEEARKRLNEILLATPTSAEAHFYLGRVEYTEKKYEEAINHFKQAATINPELDEAWVFAAAAYLNIGQARNASDSLQKLVAPSASPSPSSSPAAGGGTPGPNKAPTPAG